ncbi:hypothetical protein NC652_003587 [Populus alba x Populus x berolinensis]|nr:hypothetical protein NC652_003587 [Populus alba x Populus x berolinensis]
MVYLPMGWLDVAGRSRTMICVPIVCQRQFHLPCLAFHLWRRLVCLMPAAFYANLIPHLPMILIVNIPKIKTPRQKQSEEAMDSGLVLDTATEGFNEAHKLGFGGIGELFYLNPHFVIVYIYIFHEFLVKCG